MTWLLRWLLGGGAEDLERRRAAEYAIRKEMDAHPVEREDFVRCRHPEPAGPPQRAADNAYTRELAR